MMTSLVTATGLGVIGLILFIFFVFMRVIIFKTIGDDLGKFPVWLQGLAMVWLMGSIYLLPILLCSYTTAWIAYFTGAETTASYIVLVPVAIGVILALIFLVFLMWNLAMLLKNKIW